MNWLFRKPTLRDKIAGELYEAQLDLLKAQNVLEYNRSIAAMLTERVDRLRSAWGQAPYD